MYILYTILLKKSIVFLLFSNERLVCFLWFYGRECGDVFCGSMGEKGVGVFFVALQTRIRCNFKKRQKTPCKGGHHMGLLDPITHLCSTPGEPRKRIPPLHELGPAGYRDCYVLKRFPKEVKSMIRRLFEK